MIYSIVGKPGSGKSYMLVRLAKYFLQQGIDVYSNIILDVEAMKLKAHKPLFRKSKQLGRCYYWQSLQQFRHIHNGIVLLDEAGAYFESREWSKFSVEDRVKFQQHRKQKLDIYLTVQNFARVESTVRQLTNFVYEVRRFGNLFIRKTYVPEEMELKTKKSLGTSFYLFDINLARCYDTYEMVNLKTTEYAFKPMSDFFVHRIAGSSGDTVNLKTKGGE